MFCVNDYLFLEIAINCSVSGSGFILLNLGFEMSFGCNLIASPGGEASGS